MNTTEASNRDNSIMKLVTTGFVVWLLASIAGVALWSKEPTVVLRVFEAFSRGWVLFFCVGAVALVLAGLAVKAKAGDLGVAFALYFTPVAMLLTWRTAVNAVFRLDSGNATVDDFAGVIGLVVYAGSLVFAWAYFKRGRADAHLAFLTPPVFLALLAAGWFTVNTLTSREFVYQNAFSFHVRKVSEKDNQLVVEAVLVLRKPGAYAFHGVAWSPEPMEEPRTEAALEWKSGSAPATEGEFPLILRWNNLRLASLRSPAYYPDSLISFEIFKGSGTEKAGGSLKSFAIPVAEFAQGPTP